MEFIDALDCIQNGETVARKKWGGKAKVYLVKNKMNNIQHIEVRSITNCIMYAASSEDLLAMDWEVIHKEQPIKKVNQEDIKL